MTDEEKVMQLIREALENNLTTLNLSSNQLTHLPPEITQLKNLAVLDLSVNNLEQVPPEITQLKNLTTLNLSFNNLKQLPPEITQLKNLTILCLSINNLEQLPLEITQLKSLTKLDLSSNQLTHLPPEITQLKNLTTLNLSSNQLTYFPLEIVELNNLTKLDLSSNQLVNLPPEITQLKNLTTLNLSSNQLTYFPSEIVELNNLTKLDLSSNQLVNLPPEITQLKNLTTLNLTYNQLVNLPSEITQLKNLTTFYLSINNLEQLPSEITQLKNLTKLDLSSNQLVNLPPEITQLKSLTRLYLSSNHLTHFPLEIVELKNLTKLDLSSNQLTHLPPEITQLKNLTTLDLSYNQLTHFPPEITQLNNLTTLNLSSNQLTYLPPEITQLKNLTKLYLSINKLEQLPPEITLLKDLTELELKWNPLNSPPPEIVSRGLVAILTYLKQSKTTENNEAKLILVGNGEVGKTCLAHRLISGEFLKDVEITEGINISKWKIPSPDSESSEIKLNIWDFGGQEIYHATHQFFLTKRSVYLLIWNARKTKDYDHIYYWLHTIEAFAEDSPIILVMSKMSEHSDELNLLDLKNKFPQIVGYEKVDSCDGRGVNSLTETIRRTAWDLTLMRIKWVDSWFKIREKLEKVEENWITYDKFCEICKSEDLDSENINVLDDYLNDLGVILHFKDKLTLKNIVILKPEWATNAFYKILSTKSIRDNEGVVSQNELSKIWDNEIYPSSIYPHLMDLMNKFDLAYELPDRSGYLIAELLSKSSPDFMWDETDNLYLYYYYDYFLPSGIITRFIVRMHQDIEKRGNGMPLCWRDGVVLNLQKSRAIVNVKPDERQIEIKINGGNKRGAMGAICNQLDQINSPMRKIKVRKQIPCNCYGNCPGKYDYDKLLNAEMNNIETIQCHESFKGISVSSLLDGYKKKEERIEEYNEISKQLRQNFIFSPTFNSTFNPVFNPSVEAKSENKQIVEVEQKTDVKTDVKVDITIDLKVDLPQIQSDFDNLRREISKSNPELKNEMDEIQDSLDEVSADDEKDRLKKPLNKLRRFLDKLEDPKSDYNRIITGTQKGIELAQKVGRTYNKIAQWFAMPQVPELLVGK